MRPTPEHGQGLALPLQAWQAQARDSKKRTRLGDQEPCVIHATSINGNNVTSADTKKDGLRMTHVMSNVCGPQNTAT